MTEVFSAKDYLSLLTGSTRIGVHRMLKEFTNNFDKYESKLVHTDLLELSRTYQIGKLVSPFIRALYEIKKYKHQWDCPDELFDLITGAGCCNDCVMELYNNSLDGAKDDNELNYIFGKICIYRSNSTPLSFEFKKVDDKVKSRILGTLRQAEEFFLSVFDESLLDIDSSIEQLIDMDNTKIEDIEPPQGLKYALDIMAEKTGSGKNNNSEPATLESILPDVLKTDEAIKIFQNAIDAGLIKIGTNRLKWTKSKLLLAYFAYKCSEKLSLGKKEYESCSCKETKWKPFETVFDVNNLRQSKSDYEKYGNTFDVNPPDSNGIIDRLFK